jgi:hypothetical protein
MRPPIGIRHLTRLTPLPRPVLSSHNINYENNHNNQRGSTMRYAVKRYWEICDEVEVEANSAHEAIEVAHAMPLENSKAEYVPDSINSDPTTDVQPVERQKA